MPTHYTAGPPVIQVDGGIQGLYLNRHEARPAWALAGFTVDQERPIETAHLDSDMIHMRVPAVGRADISIVCWAWPTKQDKRWTPMQIDCGETAGLATLTAYGCTLETMDLARSTTPERGQGCLVDFGPVMIWSLWPLSVTGQTLSTRRGADSGTWYMELRTYVGGNTRQDMGCISQYAAMPRIGWPEAQTEIAYLGGDLRPASKFMADRDHVGRPGTCDVCTQPHPTVLPAFDQTICAYCAATSGIAGLQRLSYDIYRQPITQEIL